MFSSFGSHIRTKKCIVCGKEFQTPLPGKKTCSPECSMINLNSYKKVLNENNKRYYSHSRKSKNKVSK